ncbi:phosphoserine phosphatase-like [Amphiura filiformis]|uniref:phosphoserine phosphatase-like n=1 Tax=Amphiura filiformis TaxID=82378 RepID=UPI003B20B6D4
MQSEPNRCMLKQFCKKGHQLCCNFIFGPEKKRMRLSTSSETDSDKSINKMPSNANAKASYIKTMLKTADAVCFDVDSTICRDEAIDELAEHLGVGDKVAELTKKAMSQKNVEYKDTLRARLNVMKPSRQALHDFIKRHPPKLTPGIMELVQELHNRGTQVYIITGGFDSIVQEVAKELGVPSQNVYANKLLFFYNGDYAGFDETQLTCRSGGKGRAVKLIKEKHNHKSIIMVGDGSTDLEAAPPADACIGFGGNQVRETVQREAHWFIHSFKELTNVLQAAA